MQRTDYRLSQLDVLEAESVHIFREVAAEFERPVLLFSGGKDSIVMLRLAEKAFWPAPVPFPVMHVDTGHNFPEVIEYRDRRVAELGVRLVVASVQESIDKGRVVEETGRRASRNRLQTTTLLDAIEEHRFDAAFGGARRDEEKARAKERVVSFRDEFGQWDPKSQRPELWSLYNTKIGYGEHVRVFPLSNWTELDIWDYIRREQLEIPSIYFAHPRMVFERDGLLLADSPYANRDDGKSTFIGRLLYDSKSIFEDQLEAVERTSLDRGEEYTNLALLTDGLRAERELGITIDVAYRYFATPRRKFIIADTPGHIQYTR